jgi:hypothetical protein
VASCGFNPSVSRPLAGGEPSSSFSYPITPTQMDSNILLQVFQRSMQTQGFEFKSESYPFIREAVFLGIDNNWEEARKNLDIYIKKIFELNHIVPTQVNTDLILCEQFFNAFNIDDNFSEQNPDFKKLFYYNLAIVFKNNNLLNVAKMFIHKALDLDYTNKDFQRLSSEIIDQTNTYAILYRYVSEAYKFQGKTDPDSQVRRQNALHKIAMYTLYSWKYSPTA